MKDNKNGDKQEISILLHNLKQEESEEKKKIIFDELYKKYSKFVYKIAFSILKNEEDSNDIMQKVFLKIYKMKKQNLPSSGEMSWIYTVTKNETLNYLKKRYNKDISLDEVSDISKESLEMQKVLEREKINRLLKNLKNEEKEIVKLKILGDFSFREIAKMLNKSESTVKWKYYKSLNIIKILFTNIFICIISVSIFIKLRNKNSEINIGKNDNQDLTNVTIDTSKKENQLIEDSTILGEQINKQENSRENMLQYYQGLDNESSLNEEIQIEDQNVNYDNIIGIQLIPLIIFIISFIFVLICTFTFIKIFKKKH